MQPPSLPACDDHALCGSPRTLASGGRVQGVSFPEFDALLQRAGFLEVMQWQEGRGDFAVYYAQ